MQKKSSTIIIFLLLIITSILLYNTFIQKNDVKNDVKTGNVTKKTTNKPSVITTHNQEIDKLTREEVVVPYVKENGRLPDYYITKRQARQHGWIASEGNLCDVLPGRAIGGDIFTNREKRLPTRKGRTYYEADLNYKCGNRNADRLIFSDDGLIFVTHDHYKTFEKQ